MKQKYFIQQTHFIGVLLPKDLEETLENCRKYMNRTYGCKSGYGTPVHITLIPPFCLQEDFSTEDLKNGIEEYVLNRQLNFTASIENFNSFGDRTIFANVIQDENWTKLRDEILKGIFTACPGCIKSDKKPFRPHATVANRDIPQGAIPDALKVLNELNLSEDFPVDKLITLLFLNGRAAGGRLPLYWNFKRKINMEEERKIKIHGVYRHFIEKTVSSVS